jgi:hypothetical protein
VAVLVADREVPVVIPRRYSNANNKPVISCPTWALGHKVRVASLKVNSNLFVAGQIWVLGWDVPIDFLVVHFGSDVRIFIKQ